MIKNVRWTYVISDLNGEEIFEKFYKKELKKKKKKNKNQTERKDNELYIKQKSYRNSFNSWIDKKT